jgi:type IV pilus assembly protein PilY1
MNEMVNRVGRGLLACLIFVVLPLAAQTTTTTTTTAVNSAFVGTNLEAYPPNLSLKSGGAMMMLLASKDHTLFAPIYTDYEDLDGDGVLDNTYKPNFRYYGYFDSAKCYAYNGRPAANRVARFEPAETTTTDTYRCQTAGRYWSGNFLNWATMTRLDVVRKLLYGGFRREDSATDTTLEMAQLGQDAHSFVKYYGGSDIGDFTPYSADELEGVGMTICNRSSTADANSGQPVMRVVKGNYSLWATIPSSTVCRWNDEGGFNFGQKARGFYARYGTDADGLPIPAVQAHAENLPVLSLDGLSKDTYGPEYAVRVQVCATGLGTPSLATDRCVKYGAGAQAVYKPVGLLQLYGTTSQTSLPAKAEFGLMTGSYDSPIEGGALRKNIGSLNDEIDLATGRYCYLMSSAAAPVNCKSGRTVVSGIVATFDRIRLFNAGDFNANIRSSRREFVLPSDLLNGDFPSWGNPMSEMYVQALSYLAGKSVNTSGPVSANGNDASLNLPAPLAKDPLNDSTLDVASGVARGTLYGHGICRKSLALAISSSAVSYDTKDATDTGTTVYSKFATDFVGEGRATANTLEAWTDKIGSKDLEDINHTPRSVGSSNSDFGTDCTLKDLGLGSVTSAGIYQGGLSSVAGVCPEAPAVKGSYLGAGAAFFARTTAIRKDSDLTADTGAGIDKQTLPPEALRVKSYAASLSGGVARIEVPIPGTGRFVVITPESLWRHQALGDRLMPGAMLTFRAIGKQAPNLPLQFGGSGSYVVTWNDAQFGGDYDMDLVGFIRWFMRKSRTDSSKWELEVLTDVLNHNAGAQGSHGFSIIGAETGSTVGTTVYKGDGKYITHGSNGFAAPGTDCFDAQSQGSDDYLLHCLYTDIGFPVDGARTYDYFAWPTTLNGEVVDFVNTGHRYSTTVSTKFLVSSGTNSSTVALRDPLWYLAKYGSFDTGESITTPWANRRATDAVPAKSSGTNNVNWDLQHNDGSPCSGNCADGEPDGYFLARRPELLEKRLNEVFDRELNKSNTAVSVSSGQLINGGYKYVATFSESDDVRSGTVSAFQLDNTGNFASSYSWDAGRLLAAMDPGVRAVITNAPVGGVESGVGFNSTLVPAGSGSSVELTPFLTALVGGDSTPESTATKLIAYMRGSRADEGTLFRRRVAGNIMGPVVSSTPWVQNPAASARFFAKDFASGTPSYSAFVSARAANNKVLWVGSHDGMLHGFEALTGAPLISYVPSPVVSRLLSTFSVNTSQATPLVDGASFTADVLTGGSTTAAGAWHTYLFGGLGRGGKAVFALDVTNTGAGLASDGSVSKGDLIESNASTIFKWMFTASDDADLGYVVSTPVISPTSGQAQQVVRLNNGKFGLLVPNGYQSTNGRPALFIFYMDGPGATGWSETATNPTYKKLLPVDADTNNGLMGVAWLDLDNNGTADVVYATDLRGQVWKFDIRDANPSNWGSAFKTVVTTNGVASSVNLPFFEAACTGTGAARTCNSAVSITTNPALTLPSYGGVMVSFGTGRALVSGDFPNVALHNRFISVWDKGRYASDQVSPPPADDTTFVSPELPVMGTRFNQLVLKRAASGDVYREVLNDQNQPVPADASQYYTAFDPAQHDGWYFDFPSDGEQLIFSPTSRSSFFSFTSVRPRSSQELTTTCSSDALGTFYAFDGSSGQVPKGLLGTEVVNGVTTQVIGKGTEDTNVSVFRDRSNGTGTTGTNSGCIKGRLVGSTTDQRICPSATNLRLQWREIPGMKTK